MTNYVLINNFKKKIQQEPVIGIFSKTTDPAFIECSGYAGFDFIILDMEHGPNTIENIQNLIRAAQIAELLPIVRVKPGRLSLIGEVLDIGACGIQVPHITCADDVKNVIKFAKFYPEGERGLCCYVRAANYSSMDKMDYLYRANDCLIIIQIEGNEAIQNLDEIIDVSGYDVLFVGPYDLSQSLGVPGQVNHKLVEEKTMDIVRRCKQKNIVVGIFTDKERDLLRWVNIGVRYLSYSVDVGIYYNACKGILNKVKEKYELSEFD